MDWDNILPELCIKTPSKIVLLVMDGLGGLPRKGKTELEAARTPHLDELAARGACGLSDPVSMGITPGSGPAHLSLFGYDPLKYVLGRGILEALGTGVEVSPDDMVARGNFASRRGGLITDRRAGRIPTGRNEELCSLLNDSLPERAGARIKLYPGKEHRFVVRFTGKDLHSSLTDADPQKNNSPQTPARALSPEAEKTAEMVNRFIGDADRILRDMPDANSVLLRGFSKHPSLPGLDALYQLAPASIAQYPMYKGLSLLVGMTVLDGGTGVDGLFDSLRRHFSGFDFFYIHVKGTDSAGEDGNHEKKITAIEETDRFLPRLLELEPDVVCVTSDHSTPCPMKSHSWHPNPVLIHAAPAFPDSVTSFTEKGCAHGHLGRFQAKHILPLLLAHAGKLKKFGA